MNNWEIEFDKKFPDIWLDECEFNPRGELKSFITKLRRKDKEELIKRLEEKRIGQNVIINCVSRSDLKKAEEYNTINHQIYLNQQLIKDYYNN